MNRSEQNRLQKIAHDLHGLATEIHKLGYSPAVAAGAEGLFLELSTRMRGRADALGRVAAARTA